MFWRLPRNSLISAVCFLSFPYASTHTYSQGCNSLVESNTQVHASNHRHSLLDNLFLLGEARRLVFLSSKALFCRGSFFQGLPPWRAGRSRTLSLSLGFTSFLGVVFHSTLFPSRALTFLVYCTQCPQFLFPFPLFLPSPACCSTRGGLFKLSFTKREMLVTNFLFEVPDHHLFSVW